MKKNAFTLFLSLIVVVITTACEQQEDDYYTQVDITLQTNDSITPLKIQGTTSLRNLSNGRTYASSDFNNATVRLEVLRGTYMLDVEGTMLCRERNGKEVVKNFRSSKDYVEIINHPTQVIAPVIFM